VIEYSSVVPYRRCTLAALLVRLVIDTRHIKSSPMRSHHLRLAAAATLALSWTTSAYEPGYTSWDMIRAQAALMEDRPKDCPPWYAQTWLLYEAPSRGSVTK
jgi:hypothetical protein